MSEDKPTETTATIKIHTNNIARPHITVETLNEALAMLKDYKQEPLGGRLYSVGQDQAVIDGHSGAIYMGVGAYNAVGDDSFRQQLASLLGCDVDKVTAENLERVVGAARIVCNALNATADKKYRVDLWRIDQLKETLAPFKREVG